MFLSNHPFVCIILPSFKLKVILLISLVETLRLLLSNLCCIFNISVLFFMNSLKLSTSVLFFLNGSFYFQCKLLLNSFYNLLNLSFLFMTYVFVHVAFLSSSLLSFNSLYLFALNPKTSLISPIIFYFFL